MKTRNLVVVLFGILISLFSVYAGATTPFETISAAVDLSTVGAWVAGIGVTIIGIAMGFKGIDLSKRGVRKA